MAPQTANEENTKLVTKSILLYPSTTVMPVTNSQGKIIGGAIATFVPEGVQLDITVDGHTPEALDLDLTQAKIEFTGKLTNQTLMGTVNIG
jgi:hypothetical protein